MPKEYYVVARVDPWKNKNGRIGGLAVFDKLEEALVYADDVTIMKLTTNTYGDEILVSNIEVLDEYLNN